jgi:Ran GTPase-activating protein (RanGAP) involved in mRNA processing and transport
VLEALQDNDEDEDDLDDLSLMTMLLESGEEITEAPSPRTNFIMSCMTEKKNPMASLIVRKKLSKVMNLNHYGFGNDMAVLIADSLSGLPFLQSINLADNNLNDTGLIPLMKAMVSIPTLLQLDLSLNNIGMDAAILLGGYLESDSCALEKLRVKNANIDDFKCEKFVPKLTANKTLKDIDLSSNTIGAAENLNTVMPELTTGSEALAILLRSPTCALTQLDVSWNMIRLDAENEEEEYFDSLKYL